MLLLLFFFKHKTAYDMRISDWSSDVCSSDLAQALLAPLKVRDDANDWYTLGPPSQIALGASHVVLMRKDPPVDPAYVRTEERSVGKECASKGRSLWAPDQ